MSVLDLAHWAGRPLLGHGYQINMLGVSLTIAVKYMNRALSSN